MIDIANLSSQFHSHKVGCMGNKVVLAFDWLMSMKGSDNRMDEAMCLFIRWPLFMLLHYKTHT